MTRWLISVPVWGERYVDEFIAAALPSLDRAVALLARVRDVDARLVVHTDQPERVRGAAACQMEIRPVPAGARGFDCMSQAHREVLALGMRGDTVVLLTAGAVISEHGLAYCAEVLENHQIRVVLCAVPRARAEGPIPDTADAQALMAWAWEHRHEMTDECTWPDGRSTDLSRTYYTSEDGLTVATLQALPHPLAIRIDGRGLRFTPTVDANLIHCFDPSEMHVASDCNLLALVKLTPADKGFELAGASMADRAAAGQLIIGDAHQRWCLSKRITLVRGEGAVCGSEEFVAAVRER